MNGTAISYPVDPATPLSYLGSADLKSRFVVEMRRHRDEDRVVQGFYGGLDLAGRWRGCAVGCAIRSLDGLNVYTGREFGDDFGDHGALRSIGIPRWLALLIDSIHEHLSPDLAREWPLRFAEAMPVGAALSPLRHRMSAWVVSQGLHFLHSSPVSPAASRHDRRRRSLIGLLEDVRESHWTAFETGVRPEGQALRDALRCVRRSESEPLVHRMVADSALSTMWENVNVAFANLVDVKIYANVDEFTASEVLWIGFDDLCTFLRAGDPNWRRGPRAKTAEEVLWSDFSADLCTFLRAEDPNWQRGRRAKTADPCNGDLESMREHHATEESE